MTEMRKCSKCGVEKELTEEFFYKRTDKVNFEGQCKACKNKIACIKRWGVCTVCGENPCLPHNIKCLTCYGNVRKCTRCCEEKELTIENFQWSNTRQLFIARCKVCCAKNAAEYYKENKEEIDFKHEKYNEEHAEKIREYNKQKWPKIKNQRLAKERERRAKDPTFALVKDLRRRVLAVLHGTNKSAPTLEMLGCTPEYFWIYLESKFQPGMTRENKGEWHLDHIRPCASFDLTDPKQQKECFHYTNYQPLWAHDNLVKHAKLDWSLPVMDTM